MANIVRHANALLAALPEDQSQKRKTTNDFLLIDDHISRSIMTATAKFGPMGHV